MPSTPLSDLDFLQELLDTQEERSPRSKKAKDVRDEEHWWRLDHITCRCLDCGSRNVEKGFTSETQDQILTFPSKCMDCESENVRLSGECSQGNNCVGLILYDKGPLRVTAIVNEVEMCRHCFLDRLAYTGE